MKLLIASTYFTPYSSGLSVYAHRLAKGLAALGHEVVVLTSQYQKELPSEETMEGFRVIRVPVRGRISKGVLMPGLLKAAHKWITWADAVNLHLPQFESLLLAIEAKLHQKPLLVTYHCDLQIQGNSINRLAGWVTQTLGAWVLKMADSIVQNSLDYAENSRWLKPHIEKTREVPIPVELIKAD
ncbi:MAG: glycosyltransferase, partial [Chloroflexi bacterium]|nr:glycosyltransferase [Chloroflexota bacterium]